MGILQMLGVNQVEQGKLFWNSNISTRVLGTINRKHLDGKNMRYVS